MEARLFFLQRATAALLAVLTLGHLVVIFTAMRGGLSAGEILARTQGSLFWGLIYGLFVLTVAIHAPIGLRAVLREWTIWPQLACDALAALLGLVLLLLGLRAVAAVVLP